MTYAEKFILICVVTWVWWAVIYAYDRRKMKKMEAWL